ncbi:FAD dependent oxidoreductase [Purpureocillium lavendulum]|uniref:FAD dependent oxidoreductase n=1 Tax=Purpureocillium lavendulum TaxID=1247861 RepID=A0AB34FCR0_9HYPO|nr:FAD dependent oxidoreductase [Purpureocillium lavendulum]
MKLFACCIVLVLQALKVDATLYFTNFRNLEHLPEQKRRAEVYLDKLFTCENWYQAEDCATESEIPLSEKQPQLLNSLAFTLTNAIQDINSLFKSDTTAPTSVLILSASQLHESELNKLKTTLGNVMGGAKGFSITVLALMEQLNTDTVHALRTLDQYKSDTKDIIDIITVQEVLLLEQGPSAELFGKLFNGHDRSWDKRNLRDDQLYGKAQTVCDKIQLPTVEDVMRAVKAA